MKTVDYYELQMVALFGHITGGGFIMFPDKRAASVLCEGNLVVMPLSKIEPDSEAQKAVEEHLFAEVNIPHRTTGKGYVYTFHVFGLPNPVPAIREIAILHKEIAAIHEIYHEQAEYVGPVEVEDHL